MLQIGYSKWSLSYSSQNDESRGLRSCKQRRGSSIEVTLQIYSLGLENSYSSISDIAVGSNLIH